MFLPKKSSHAYRSIQDLRQYLFDPVSVSDIYTVCYLAFKLLDVRFVFHTFSAWLRWRLP